MPYPDSEYPSILRGKDKRESQRLLTAAPELLELMRSARVIVQSAGHMDLAVRMWNAIAKAEGRE